MQLRNPHDDARYLPAIGDYVESGATVDLPDDLAASLVDQGWPEAKPARARRSSPDPTTEADPAAPQEA